MNALTSEMKDSEFGVENKIKNSGRSSVDFSDVICTPTILYIRVCSV